jgi:hypothetical protein
VVDAQIAGDLSDRPPALNQRDGVFFELAIITTRELAHVGIHTGACFLLRKPCPQNRRNLTPVRLLLALARRPTKAAPVRCTRCHIGQMRLFALCTLRGAFRAGPRLLDSS